MSRHTRHVAVWSLLIVASTLTLAWRLPGARSAPPTHPLTGRQIAGIATNIRWLDRTEREAEELPGRVLDLIGVGPGMTIADVGAGSGYMTVRLARRIGPSGRVYASDLQLSMLAAIQEKARRAQLANIQIVQGTERDARLPQGAIDVALLIDVYHELWRPQEMLRSIRGALKPGGRLILVEYRKEDRSLPIAMTHRMSVAEARTEVEAEGYVFDRLVSELPRQHILVFRPATPSE